MNQIVEVIRTKLVSMNIKNSGKVNTIDQTKLDKVFQNKLENFLIVNLIFNRIVLKVKDHNFHVARVNFCHRIMKKNR